MAVGRVIDTGEQRRFESLKKLTAIVYGLQAASLLVGFTALAGVIVNYVKYPDVRGTWLAAHFDYQIRTFWWSLLWVVVGMATALHLVGFAVLLGGLVWFVYRVVRGWLRLQDNRTPGVW